MIQLKKIRNIRKKKDWIFRKIPKKIGFDSNNVTTYHRLQRNNSVRITDKSGINGLLLYVMF